MFQATIVNVITIIQITYNNFEWKLYPVFYLIKLQLSCFFYYHIISIYLFDGRVSGEKSFVCSWTMMAIICCLDGDMRPLFHAGKCNTCGVDCVLPFIYFITKLFKRLNKCVMIIERAILIFKSELFCSIRGNIILEHQLVRCNRLLLWPFQLKPFITSNFCSEGMTPRLCRSHKSEKWWEFNLFSFFERIRLCLVIWTIALEMSIVLKTQKGSSIIFFNKSTLENYFAQLQMFHCLLLKYLKCPLHLLKWQ